MPDDNLVAAEAREVSEGRLSGKQASLPLAPLLDGPALDRYVFIASHWSRIRSKAAASLPADVHQSEWCQALAYSQIGPAAAQALKSGNTAFLSYMTGLTNREVDLSEARTLVRLLGEMRRDGYLGLFVGDTDNGKTNTALWLALLCLLDHLDRGEDVCLATNVTSLEWSDDRLNQITHQVSHRSGLEQLCNGFEKVVCVLDELELEANATTQNHEVVSEFGRVLTFKSKYGLVLFPIFHRTDGLGAAPTIREHATHFLRQRREKRDLEEDRYFADFYDSHDAETGFSGKQYEIPVPPLQPDGDYDPDEQAAFDISA